MFDYFLRQIVYPTRNPLYQLNTKCFQPERLSRDAQLILASGIGLAALWWFAEVAFTDATTSGRYLSALGTLFFGSLALTLAADVFYAIEAVNTIQQETVRGTWDLLRLSRLPAREIAAAKYAVVQLRVWRVVALEFAIRAAVLTLIVLPSVRFGFSLALTLTVTGVLLASLYWLEVWWRARAIISISLLLALIFPKPINAVIVAALCMIGLHSLQGLFLAICYGALLLMLAGEFTLGFLCGMPLCALIAVGGTLFLCERVTQMALQRLERHINYGV
jgi:hypothetical protein